MLTVGVQARPPLNGRDVTLKVNPQKFGKEFRIIYTHYNPGNSTTGIKKTGVQVHICFFVSDRFNSDGRPIDRRSIFRRVASFRSFVRWFPFSSDDTHRSSARGTILGTEVRARVRAQLQLQRRGEGGREKEERREMSRSRSISRARAPLNVALRYRFYAIAYRISRSASGENPLLSVSRGRSRKSRPSSLSLSCRPSRTRTR